MLVGPVKCDGAAALQYDDERLAGRSKCFQQLLLRRGQIEAGAIAAIEAVDLDGHLFAFKLRREADECDDDIGFLGTRNGLIDLRLRWSFPFQRHAAAGLIGGVRILQD